jgi:uncharacterized phosphosugar-binding protein
VKELGKSICPSSGIGAAYLLWALECCVVEELVHLGVTPSVYVSNHMPNAGKLNSDAWETYEKFGW